MEAEAEKKLKVLLAKDPSELTEPDKAFLKARWSYVGKNSRSKFADALKIKAVKVEKSKEEKVADTEDESETEDTGTVNNETDDTVED